MIDWSQCPDVESVPDRCHGAPVVKGTRVMVQGILDNADEGCSAEEIATEIFELPVDVVRRILRFAYQKEVTATIGPAEPPWPPKTPETEARLRTLVSRLRELHRALERNKPPE
jgi:uncharacterized protein (DUF433 family)